jgi:NADP-dependent 3-hydroxy acid dehydrogenase YdfG
MRAGEIMFGDMSGQVVIITGASRLFANAGARVVAVARTESDLNSLAAEIGEAEGVCLPLPADIADEEDVKRVVDTTMEEFGQIDVLVNNAGVARYNVVVEAPTEDWDWMIGTNLRGPFLLTREVLQHMIPRRSGHIINVASVAGKKGYRTAAIYCTSKFGLIGFSESLAKQLREHNVKVTTICPGTTHTHLAFGLIESRREYMAPEDVARAIVFAAAQPPGVVVHELTIMSMKEEP